MTRISGTTFSDSNAPTYMYVVYHLENYEGGLGLRGGTIAVFHRAYKTEAPAKKAAEGHDHLMWAAVPLASR